MYSCDQAGDAYVLVMECQNEEVAIKMFHEFDNDVLDSSSYNKKTKEDLQGALETAFLNSSKAMSMLIGTEIIEEDYFEKLD